uniref:Macaca fascicularis brain cDNA clone: QorA-12859, similar to human PI-3-kinase-related kinase SMG-1 (SMG1), transcriptvariant 2, mRNA, RefSeq: NM_014006.2 n=1 Tax=Macaca fascicularis TaxID=9541 RepID=I7GK54_MACFA|nr:unnamed protein product [Macaca fascicularis]
MLLPQVPGETSRLFMVVQESSLSSMFLVLLQEQFDFSLPRAYCFHLSRFTPTDLLSLESCLSPHLLTSGLSFILRHPSAPTSPGYKSLRLWDWVHFSCL